MVTNDPNFHRTVLDLVLKTSYLWKALSPMQNGRVGHPRQSRALG